MSAPLLAYSLVTPTGEPPQRFMWMLHGILGRRTNLRSLARRVVEERPGWGVVLVDLRLHGDSQGFGPPHRLDNVAADLEHLAQSIERPVHALLGHSFGGKVAMQFAARAQGALASALGELWVLDSSPDGDIERLYTSDVGKVLGVLDGLTFPLPTREAFLEGLAQAGISKATAEWLAMNLKRNDEGLWQLNVDLPGVRTLLEDYFRHDLWSVLEEPPAHTQVHLVIGGRSESISAEARARAASIAQKQPRLQVHLLAEAGHWVHVDAFEALARLLIAQPRFG